MCGICGFAVNNYNKNNCSSLIKSMTHSLNHRGPDDIGIHIDDDISLGMTRLSIIDPLMGKQPLFSSDGNSILVFNGEIYNYKKLRTMLEPRYSFLTNTDTEVLVAMYSIYGIKMLKYINGMFAFAIFDLKTKKLFLGRDRIGEKPLYYYHKGEEFVFGSEIKAILCYPVKTKIKMYSLSEYLFFDFFPQGCIYNDIKKLKPGEVLEYSNNRIIKHKYWSIISRKNFFSYNVISRKIKKHSPSLDETQFTNNIYKNISFKEACRTLRSLLSEAVRDQLQSDVPIGVFISGGIDSSIIAYLATRYSKKKLSAYSISFMEASFNETSYASEIVEYLGMKHNIFMFNSETALSIMPDVFSRLDEPFGDPSILPTYYLSKKSRDFITVALGGDGSDELFGGYPHYKAHKILSLLPPISEDFWEKIAVLIQKILYISDKDFSLDFKLNKFLNGIRIKDNSILKGYDRALTNYSWLGSFTEEELKYLFKPKVYLEINKKPGYFLSSLYTKIQNSGYSKYNSILILDILNYLSEDILYKTDRASMFNSLELRAPFLDRRIVEFAFSIPDNYKIHWFKLKRILKEAFKNEMPKSILYRKKKGFGIPLSKWIRKDFKFLVEEFLIHEKKEWKSPFNHNYIKHLFLEHLERKANHAKKIWLILSYMLWRNFH